MDKKNASEEREVLQLQYLEAGDTPLHQRGHIGSGGQRSLQAAINNKLNVINRPQTCF